MSDAAPISDPSPNPQREENGRKGKGKGRGAKGRGKSGAASRGNLVAPQRRASRIPDRGKKTSFPGFLCCAWFKKHKNPDKGLGYLSNENTASPLVNLFPWLFETNPCCRCMGGIVLQVGALVRKIIFITVLFINLLLIVFFILGLIGNISPSFPWYKGTATTIPSDGHEAGAFQINHEIFGSFRKTELIGVNQEQKEAIQKELTAPTNTDLTGEINKVDADSFSVTWTTNKSDPSKFDAEITSDPSSLCTIGLFKSELTCGGGYWKFYEFIAIMVCSIITLIAASFMSCQRFTAYGDINCQKWSAIIAAVFGAIMAASLYFMALGMKENFLPSKFFFIGWRNFSFGSEPTTPVKWELGAVLHLVLVAMIINLLLAIVHFLIAGPPGRKQTIEYGWTSLEDYMAQTEAPRPGLAKQMTEVAVE